MNRVGENLNLGVLRPYMLLCIPLAIVFLVYTSKYMGKMQKARKLSILAARAGVLILLILSAAGLSIKWKVDEVSTIFVVDCSDSMAQYKNQVEDFIKEAVDKKSNKDKIGIVTFGDNALIENFVSNKAAFESIETIPTGTYTDIENALNTATSIIPENTKKRIVLITDGEENKGVSSKTAPYIIDQGIDFKIHKIIKDESNDAAVDKIIVPQTLNVGEEFNIVVNIKSTTNTETDLTIFTGNEKSITEKVKLSKGDNTFVFKDKATQGGFKSYKVYIEPKIDGTVKNNEASTFTNIKSQPKILVVEDEKGKADELIKMLEASSMDYTRINAKSVPKSLESLSVYKTIITCDVSAENLNEKFLNNLETYVKELGGGFIAAGGRNSFALGGYFKTPLEKILPVNMDMKGKKEIPSMAIVLVIDKSGSMGADAFGYNKIELAKEAAVRTLDALRPNKDEIGVLAFDDRNYWVVERNKIENKEDIKSFIGSLRADGGTSIIPALNQALKSLKESEAGIKHVILLTDGQAERAGYEEILKEFNDEAITVSTVAVGEGADVDLLKNIANSVKGRFYFTDNSSTIPKIFAKETYMVTRAYINNREFTPVVSSYHPILTGAVENGLPTLLGYIGASPKDTAKVLLKSDEDDPILTVWQYGLGKTAAWNSDINGKWSANYIGWDKNTKLWQNIINFTIENYGDKDTFVEVNVKGEKAEVILNSKNIDEGAVSSVSIINPSLESFNVKLEPTEPGKFTGEFQVKEKGVYLLKAIQKKEGKITSAVNSGFAMQYSPEYKIKPKNNNLDILAAEAGGNYITTSQEVYEGKLKDISGKTDISNILLIIALILFVLDIAIRRLNIPYKKIKNRFIRFIDSIKVLINKLFNRKSNHTVENNFTANIKNAVNKSTDDRRNENSYQKESVKKYSQEKSGLNSNNENIGNFDGKSSSENLSDSMNKKDKIKNDNIKDSLDTSCLLKIKKKKRNE